jgi:GNAT superfamily N-acetyltransferase
LELDVRQLKSKSEMEALYDLRLRVLRPGRSPHCVRHDRDLDPGAVHIGAFHGARLAGIASLLPADGLQLRGMAVEPDLRKSGVGAAILRYAHRIAAERNLSLWCNARDSALGFYEKSGWVVEGEGFEVPDIGPHHVMRWAGP